MIARMPASASAFVLSSRLGLVSLPDLDPVSLSQEEELDRNTVRECLRELGRSLGLSLLDRTGEDFPGNGTEGAASGTEAESGSAFFDEAVRKSLEGLDAVWMADGELVACFVVESGFAGWEGLRRLADLIALYPKLKAPIYAVTLPALKAGLLAEAHRPVYGLAKKPLAERLRLLDWEKLRAELDQLGERVRYLKPEFLEGLSDSVTPPKA